MDGVEDEDFVRSNVIEVREMRLFIESHFEPIIHLACVISARHPSGVEADVRALYKRWGIDGECCLFNISAVRDLGAYEMYVVSQWM